MQCRQEGRSPRSVYNSTANTPAGRGDLPFITQVRQPHHCAEKFHAQLSKRSSFNGWQLHRGTTEAGELLPLVSTALSAAVRGSLLNHTWNTLPHPLNSLITMRLSPAHHCVCSCIHGYTFSQCCGPFTAQRKLLNTNQQAWQPKPRVHRSPLQSTLQFSL